MNEKNIFLSEIDKPSTLQFSIRIIPKLISLLIRATLFLPLWPIYWLGWLVWYRPPNVPPLSQTLRYLKLAWTVSPENPKMSFLGRFWLSLSMLEMFLSSPLTGLAWLLDELFYGRSLNKASVNEPFFVISAGRSGSTQITRYIEEDDSLVVPNTLQLLFPYLWLWHLMSKTLGKVIKPEKVRELFLSAWPAELIERHDLDPYKADTFDIAFFTFHLNRFSLYLGPEVAKEDFLTATNAPYDKQIFVQFVDRLARKAMAFSGVADEGGTRRFYLKGHFLYMAQALSEAYPDASFLTVIREPVSRMRSVINYMRVNPPDPVLGPVPWAWLTNTLMHTEVSYNRVEQEWFTRDDNTRRSVIKFSRFVNDLEGSMKQVYLECFGTEEVPPHVPAAHSPRDRKNYTVNRSLEDLGVDEVELKNSLRDYIEWCQ